MIKSNTYPWQIKAVLIRKILADLLDFSAQRDIAPPGSASLLFTARGRCGYPNDPAKVCRKQGNIGVH
jgi:hypothetical protein